MKFNISFEFNLVGDKASIPEEIMRLCIRIVNEITKIPGTFNISINLE